MSKLGIALVCLSLVLSSGGCGDDDGGGGTSGTGNSGSGGSGGTGGSSGTGGTGGTGGETDSGTEGTVCDQALEKLTSCADAGDFDPSTLDGGLGECVGLLRCVSQCQLEPTCEELISLSAGYAACTTACVQVDGGTN